MICSFAESALLMGEEVLPTFTEWEIEEQSLDHRWEWVLESGKPEEATPTPIGGEQEQNQNKERMTSRKQQPWQKTRLNLEANLRTVLWASKNEGDKVLLWILVHKCPLVGGH